MAIEIVAAKRDKLADEDAVRVALAKMRPNKTIESVVAKGDNWIVRLADKPPFLQDKDPDGDGDDDSSPATDTDNDGGDGSDEKSNEKGDKPPFGEKGKGDEPKGDVASELKDLIGQLQDVLKQVTDKATDAVSEVEDHRDKLDKAKDALGEGQGGDGPIPSDVGPVPGGPPVPGADAESLPAPGGKPPMPPRRPGVPTGRGMAGPRPGLPTAFTKRQTEIVSHAGVDQQGNAVTLLEAASALEADPEWSDYKVVGMTENRDGTFSAKLQLR
jgi:hypothetical protein